MQTPWGDLAVEDAHVHFFSRRFFQTLGSQAGKSAEETAQALGWEFPGTDPAELAQSWAANLDQFGVRRAALIASVPGDEESVKAAKAACPGRFLAFGMVNPAGDQHATLDRLDAICFFPAMHRYSMHDPRVLSVIEGAVEHRCAVFVHCGVLTVGVRRKLGLASPFDMRFSNPLDVHALALRFPDVPFIVPHFGAGYLREAVMLADLCPNVYLDTSSSNSWMRYEGIDLQTAFRRAIATVGAERLLFGTDSSFFPRGWNYDIFETQAKALVDLGISDIDARLIFGENLARIFS
jgi:predicted TIM-barrel fold metal-dependent hydrolase